MPSRSYTNVEEHKIKPYELRHLKKHQCVLVHCERGFKRTVLAPLEPDGESILVAQSALVLIRCAYRLRTPFRQRVQSVATSSFDCAPFCAGNYGNTRGGNLEINQFETHSPFPASCQRINAKCDDKFGNQGQPPARCRRRLPQIQNPSWLAAFGCLRVFHDLCLR